MRQSSRKSICDERLDARSRPNHLAIGSLPTRAQDSFHVENGRIQLVENEMSRPTPEWFKLAEETTAETMKRISDAIASPNMALQVKSAPMLAHWFMLDSLLLANQANRDGMHANALALTRQCIEAVGIIELGICGHVDAEATLARWDQDRITPGKLRAWLQDNVWDSYRNGLWNEPWTVFMREFAAAIQPYAHYGPNLAQWQLRLHSVNNAEEPDKEYTAVIEMRPHAYDPQKATRITLYHALLTYVLGRVWLAANPTDSGFSAAITDLGAALGRSRYLDGHSTNWGQQFWAMLWERNGETVFE